MAALRHMPLLVTKHMVVYSSPTKVSTFTSSSPVLNLIAGYTAFNSPYSDHWLRLTMPCLVKKMTSPSGRPPVMSNSLIIFSPFIAAS